ncbi:MAG: TIGR01777 family protein [Gammaproteobacteria bacterium RIFCSPHIGHO2_12_FULL_43_28]|nr:MAG: TIGR01777 family protein [Gammaproteobacteria bacterium RIFCSPHIGHO2_12_FULL_43_28]
MHRIITGATGLIGGHLVRHWLQQKHKVTVIGRTKVHIEQVFGDTVRAVTWEEVTTDLLREANAIINLAGTNIGDARWTKTRKQDMLNSRVQTTALIANLLAPLGAKSPPLLNASAIGIYGLQQQIPHGLPKAFDENTQIDCDSPPDFLAEIACAWEKAAASAKENGVRVIHLRFAVVLAKSGGALPKLIQPFKLYVGGVIGTGRQPFSWVAIEDVVRAIDFLLSKQTAAGPFNVVAPNAITQRELAKTIAQVLARPNWLPTPAFALKIIFGEEMAQDLLLEGQHAYPKRLIDLGFQFAYPDIELALRHLLQ